MSENSRIYWLGLVTAISGAFIVFFANIPSLNKFMITALSASYSHSSQINENGWSLLAALSGVGGGVMVGWGITLMALSRYYTRDTRKILFIALNSWFILDTLTSLFNSFQYNAILNLGFYVFALWALSLPISDEPSNK